MSGDEEWAQIDGGISHQYIGPVLLDPLDFAGARLPPGDVYLDLL